MRKLDLAYDNDAFEYPFFPAMEGKEIFIKLPEKINTDTSEFGDIYELTILYNHLRERYMAIFRTKRETRHEIYNRFDFLFALCYCGNKWISCEILFYKAHTNQSKQLIDYEIMTSSFNSERRMIEEVSKFDYSELYELTKQAVFIYSFEDYNKFYRDNLFNT